MRKSDEIKTSEELPEVDYTKLPKELEEIVGQEPYKIEKKVMLTWDGRQFIARIPSEIAKEMGITKGNQILFKMVKPPQEKPMLNIELV